MATVSDAYDPYAIPTRRMSRDDLLRAAEYFEIDATGLDLEALRTRVKQVGEARFIEENREAIEEFNAWVRTNGIPHSDLHLI